MEETLLWRKPSRIADFGTPCCAAQDGGLRNAPSPRQGADDSIGILGKQEKQSRCRRRRRPLSRALLRCRNSLPPALPHTADPGAGAGSWVAPHAPRPAEVRPRRGRVGGSARCSARHGTASRRVASPCIAPPQRHSPCRAVPSQCAGAPQRPQVPRRRKRGRAALASQPWPGAAS